MATVREQIAKGSKIAILLTMTGLPQNVEFTDDDVDFTLHFFVNGKRTEAVVDVTKADVVVSQESTNVFYAILDTTTLPLGDVVCEGEVTYTFDTVGKAVLDKPFFDCEVEIIENT